MKASRLITVLIAIALAFSSLAPSVAYAKSAKSAETGADFSIEAAKGPKVASLTVHNRTKGILYVRLSGPATYSFVAADQGKTTFNNITPGRYTIVLSTSACTGTLTYTKNLKGKSSLKPVSCR
jgi:hypothetical protein